MVEDLSKLFKIVDALFFAKLQRMPNGCLEWQGGKVPSGYGSLTRRWLTELGIGRTIGAHQYAWYLATGELPVLDTLHHCDNPPCCDPTHLFEGDDQINQQDCSNKDRRGKQFGKDNGNYGNVIYSDAVIEGIKQADSTKVAQVLFGVSNEFARLVRLGKRRAA